MVSFKKWKIKAVVPLLMILGLVLVGGLCTQSAESFYKKVCKLDVEFGEALEGFMDDHSEYGGYEATYDDVDDCIEESVEQEDDYFDSCMDEEDDDEDECNRNINDMREMIAKYHTRDRCMDSYEEYCDIYDDDDDWEECIDDVEDLCKIYPKSF